MDTAEYVLTNIPLISERIMSFLSICDLMRIQSVCKAWKMSSMNVLQARKDQIRVEYITYRQDFEDDTKPVSFKRSNREIKWKKDSRMYKVFSDWRKEWHCAPVAGICFSMFNNRKKKSLYYDTENIIRYWLPPNNKLLVLSSVYSVVCLDDDNATTENDAEDIKGVYNYLALPQSSSNAFSVNFLNLQVGHSSEDHDDFTNNIRDEIEHCDTKLVFICEPVFHNLPMPTLHSDIFTPAARRGVVVIGCLFESPMIYNPQNLAADKNNAQQDIVMVSFKGKNVRSASVLIGPDVDTVKELGEGLRKLQQTVITFSSECPNKCKFRDRTGHCASCNSQTLGFMVACCARADPREWYVEENSNEYANVPRNLEQETFRKMIPNAPLLGTYGMGEIGACINLIGAEHKLLEDFNDLFRSESTVFAVVMLK